MYNFSEAIERNVERTFTYSHAKNAHNYDPYNTIQTPYNAMQFFLGLLKLDPFGTLMELDGYQFKNSKNTLDRYNIPYKAEQERQARVYNDVTTKMQKERSDTVSMYVENLHNTGIVKLNEQYLLTTEKTLSLAKLIDRLPKKQRTTNVIYENKLPKTLIDSREQMEALELCLTHQVSCLIGGAGTGKSFVTSNIIEQLLQNRKKVAILAPTHKAKEALQEKLKRGTVRTIHSFVHKDEEECDVIVIDESGMLSTPLLHSLLKRYNDKQLIFIGDKNQLPPIEYGRPFELIQQQFATYEIKQNRRSESADIIALSREILGIPQNANMAFDNIKMVHTTEEAYELGADVVLTFTNANVAQINEQRRLKTGEQSICSLFKVGEEIMAKTNVAGRFYNGQLYKVIGRDRIQNKSTGRIIVMKNRFELEYNFVYAYGLTVHKSQGSEWDVVAYQPSELDSQNIAYVAVTRAKKTLIIIGDGLKSIYPPERKWRQLNENYII